MHFAFQSYLFLYVRYIRDSAGTVKSTFFFRYITTGCNTLKLILKHFGPVIKTNIQSPVGSFGVDLSREERYRKSVKCHEHLVKIRSFLLKKQTTPGTVGSTFKEVTTLMENTLD